MKKSDRRHRDAYIDVDADEALTAFSDDDNEFYVDEVEATLSKDDRKEHRKKREKKPSTPSRRRVLRIVSYCLIVAVILIVGVVLSLTVLFKTQSYEVTGTDRYTADQIAAVSGIVEGENIFLAPKAPAERRIKDEFPYVEDVDVTFRIPDTIRIHITEAVEGYLVKATDTEYLLISTRGRILDRVSDISGYDLPIFIGPDAAGGEIGDYVDYEDQTVMGIIDEITGVFADNGYQGITEIDATNPASISFTYDDRIKVKLGLPEDLSYKIRTAMTIIEEKIDVNTAAAIEGVLDVSRCNETKRSYFDETPLLSLDATEAPTDGQDDTTDSGDDLPDSDIGQEPQTELSVDDWYL